MSRQTIQRIRKGLGSGYPLIYVRSDEEGRLEALLQRIANAHYGDERPLVGWTGTRGFVRKNALSEPVTDPLQALRHIHDHGQSCFYLLKDFPLLLDGRPELTRALRDLYAVLPARNCFVFLSCSEVRIPDALARQIFIVSLEPPHEDEVLALLKRMVSQQGVAPRYPESVLQPLAASMRGFTLDEITHLLKRLIASGITGVEACLAEIHEDKAVALMREGCLKYIDARVDLERVGGLENLKEWVTSRSQFFTRGGLASGVPLPSGVLFMGVSGCGKSMAAKVIAGAWSLPLVRLDMNLVLSGAHGSPEYAFDRALRVAEQMAPLVLWIDEMENSFGYDTDQRGGINPNIFSSFLTWMQEKPAGVFVVATANRIEKLPAEVIRKGRFDQLFFLDLPNDEERKQIFRIHLDAAGADAATAFDLGALAAVTRNWSGSEIEQAVRAAVVRAWQEKRPFTERDVFWSASRMVPLSKTMDEQIKQLRAWSQERATPASRKPPA